MRTTASDQAFRVSIPDGGRPAPGELRDALDRLLSNALPHRRILDLETSAMPYASSFALEEIRVRLDDGDSVDIVCKDTGQAAMLAVAQRIKPRFLYNPIREIATYESILAPLGIDAPRFYGRIIDGRRGRYWLFLERVSGRPLTEIGEFEVWRNASAWLARMHSRVASEPAMAHAATAVPLLRYDRAHWRRWRARAERHVQGGAEPLSRRTRFAQLASRYEAVVEQTTALPAGFVHGEFFASNVLVQHAGTDVRVCPLDWELAGIGPVLIDLAALTAGRWSDTEQTALAMSYHAALDPDSELWLPREAFVRALDCCRLLIAVRQLGWAAQWTPPSLHTQDWLGHALHAAERIGL
jgi:aminoglycoside phosphotransferase (APT) family kinase protein